MGLKRTDEFRQDEVRKTSWPCDGCFSAVALDVHSMISKNFAVAATLRRSCSFSQMMD